MPENISKDSQEPQSSDTSSSPVAKKSDETSQTPTHKKRSAIVLNDLELIYQRNTIYGPTSFTIPEGGLHVLKGPRSRTRECLALTIGGRMKQTSGELSVFGATTAREICKIANIACFHNIDHLDPNVRVQDLITEQITWHSPWYSIVRPSTQETVNKMCAPIFGERPVPNMRLFVGELSELDEFLLRIVLAEYESSQLLIVNDFEQLRSFEDQEFAVACLASIAEHKTVILLTVEELPPSSPPHQTICFLSNEEAFVR